jgi:actin-related protein
MNKLSRTLSALRQKLKAGDLDSDELLTRLALWGGYVTNKGVDIVSEVTTHDSVFSEVVKTEQDYWRDTKNRFIQMMDEKRERDALHEQRRAQRLADEALKKGMEKSRIEGKAEGKIEVARNMLSKGFPLGEIADCTGLREEEIRALRETLL